MSDRERQRILIIDDAADNRRILADLLKADHKVILAKSGTQGLEKAFQHLPDLILLDVMMPDLDGFEVLRRLKADARTAAIGVVFITGLNTPEDEERGLRGGVADYIAKPFHHAVVAARVELHLRLARQRKLLESLANVDALTELPNRRHLDHALSVACRRAAREGTWLAVAMVDVDQFKRYNDQFGHAAGDRVLQAVARTLARSVNRPGDLAGRYGGEEFVLVLPNTDAAQVQVVAERARAAVEALILDPGEGSPAAHITISIGTAAAEGRAGLTAEHLLKTADERLYQAKAAGRNRVVGGE